MYVPAHFAANPDQVRALLARPGAADLITPTTDGLQATFLPLLLDPDAGEHGSLLGHLARNNPHWQAEPTGASMVILRGPDSYVSPAWYAAKAEHGRVVPTWNYLTVHVHGELIVHDDVAWLDGLVRRLSDHHEAGREQPWSVDDAPAKFVQGQLRAIVGIEVRITRIEAKAKYGQNRSEADRAGVVAGLRAEGDLAGAEAVRLA